MDKERADQANHGPQKTPGTTGHTLIDGQTGRIPTNDHPGVAESRKDISGTHPSGTAGGNFEEQYSGEPGNQKADHKEKKSPDPNLQNSGRDSALSRLLASPGRLLRLLFPGITPLRTLLSTLHAVWMIALVLLWLGHVNYLDGFGFMNDYFSMRSFLNQYILHTTPGSDLPAKFLLLNSSQNNALVPLDNDHLTNTVITDRRMLAEKLKILDQHANRLKFILCDIFFEFPSADTEADSLLQEVLLSLSQKNKIVFPSYYNDLEKSVNPPVFDGTTGLSQYRSSFLNAQFLKYSFITYEGWRQMPLIAWEAVSGKKMKENRWGPVRYYTHDGKWVLNTVIPEFRYSQDLLAEGENYFQLGLFEEYLLGENQVVVIGDVEGRNDIHTSVTGMDAGPVILMNLYASLEEGDHLIPPGYLMLLLALFFYVTYHTFYHRREMEEGETRRGKILSTLWNQRCYIILLILVYLSMIIFHHYIHILILLSYFGLIDLVDKYILNRKMNP
ncbi:MAG: hypothetical protein GXY59_06800 [Bacteroidales bacterium]|nr:hypothetical protein [Bacteroidales bacterium]